MQKKWFFLLIFFENLFNLFFYLFIKYLQLFYLVLLIWYSFSVIFWIASFHYISFVMMYYANNHVIATAMNEAGSNLEKQCNDVFYTNINNTFYFITICFLLVANSALQFVHNDTYYRQDLQPALLLRSCLSIFSSSSLLNISKSITLWSFSNGLPSFDNFLLVNSLSKKSCLSCCFVWNFHYITLFLQRYHFFLKWNAGKKKRLSLFCGG